MTGGFNVKITCSAGREYPYVREPAREIINVTLVPGEPVPAVKIPPADYPIIVAVEIEAVTDEEGRTT